MGNRSFLTLPRVAGWAAIALIGNVLLVTLLNYRDYLPPNFQADFLLGRERYFWQGYHWAFFAHIFAGPLSLALGPLLVSGRFRAWAPAWHRRLGKLQLLNVIVLVVPSGLVMALWAAGGWPAGVGLGALGLSTLGCAWWGWRAAVGRRFAQHRRWMWRLFALLGSAVVLRALGGLTEVLQLESALFPVVNAWIGWLLPLGICEIVLRRNRTGR
jgi:hypothetical protein